MSHTGPVAGVYSYNSFFADTPKMKIQSNGMGTQSLAMYLMSSTGVLPRFDYSIFVDTGKEKPRTYEMLIWLQKWQKKNNGIPLIIIKEKNLYNDLIIGTNSSGNRFAPIPAFTKSPNNEQGILRRQCTNEYKIAQIQKKIKELQGKGKNQMFDRFFNFIGISLEELKRVSRPLITREIRIFPFCNYVTTKQKGKIFGDKFFQGYGMSRSNIRRWLKENDYPDPGKSSCAFCPFMNDKEWLEIKKDKKVWGEIVFLDKQIRNSSKKGIIQPIFLHESLVPLDEVDFIENQTNLFDECEGFCHI